jgi:hypothetical protein
VRRMAKDDISPKILAVILAWEVFIRSEVLTIECRISSRLGLALIGNCMIIRDDCHQDIEVSYQQIFELVRHLLPHEREKRSTYKEKGDALLYTA